MNSVSVPYSGWDLPYVEWVAWRSLCELLEARGVNINTDNELARSIERWGEELVALRVSQTPDERAKALADRRQQVRALQDG